MNNSKNLHGLFFIYRVSCWLFLTIKLFKMKILIGCEESQEICKVFRAKGFEAYSCDLQESSGGNPEWHLQMDVFEAIELIKPTLAIFHPPCTFMSRAGARWMYPTAGNLCENRYKKAMEAKEFFYEMLKC